MFFLYFYDVFFSATKKNTERFRESASFFRPRFFLGPMGSSVSCLEEEDKKDVTWTRILGGEKSGGSRYHGTKQ